MQFSNIDIINLKAAFNATSQKRGAHDIIKQYNKIMDTVKSSNIMQKQWNKYQKDFVYAKEIQFDDCCDTVIEIMKSLSKI